MSNRPVRIAGREIPAEAGRILLSALLVVLLAIPAAIIYLAVKLTDRWVQGRGGID